MTGGEWKSTLPGFFAPVKLLSKLFRMEFERLLRRELPKSLLPGAADLRREFVSHVEPVGDGVATLKLNYLSRYVFRTAMTNDRMLAMRAGQVTFAYRRSGEQRDRRMTLPVFEFLRRFLQHVLPRRLQKIRHYGFLSRNAKTTLDDVRQSILESLRDVEPDLELEDWTVPALRSVTGSSATADCPKCPDCGGRLIFERFDRIRPPPLNHRKTSSHGAHLSQCHVPRFETIQNRARWRSALSAKNAARKRIPPPPIDVLIRSTAPTRPQQHLTQQKSPNT